MRTRVGNERQSRSKGEMPDMLRSEKEGINDLAIEAPAVQSG